MHQNPLPYSSNIINNNINNNNISLEFPEHEHLNCPRCDSNNTKFCYYNNYNLSQPRHYCKNCRRYWTKGGTLRKIPIGGGTRKPNKRSSPNSSASSNKRPITDSVSDSSKSTVLLPPDGSEKKDLDKSGVFQVNFLSMNSNINNNNNNNNNNDGDGDGESSGDVWPNLSIFTSGSNLR